VHAHRYNVAAEPFGASPAADELLSHGGSSHRGMYADVTDRRREQLFDAFSQLHALAQDCDINLSSPAILVVGQQTDGKSALIEALMGFNFNHVRGAKAVRACSCLCH